MYHICTYASGNGHVYLFSAADWYWPYFPDSLLVPRCVRFSAGLSRTRASFVAFGASFSRPDHTLGRSRCWPRCKVEGFTKWGLVHNEHDWRGSVVDSRSRAALKDRYIPVCCGMLKRTGWWNYEALRRDISQRIVMIRIQCFQKDREIFGGTTRWDAPDCTRLSRNVMRMVVSPIRKTRCKTHGNPVVS